MSNQVGARFLSRKNRVEVKKDEICINHYKSDEISIEVKPGVRKRLRVLKRKAE